MLAGALALTILLPMMALADPELERSSHPQSPRITGFNVDEVTRLRPGVELNFAMSGSPGGRATLRIAGAAHNLVLQEVEVGQYEGTYTIGNRDKIAARSRVTANLRLGNQVASDVLDESLQIGVGYHDNSDGKGPAPAISRFQVGAVNQLSPGNELPFSVFGSGGGKVSLTIAGVRGKVLLAETNSGEYSGVYTIRVNDRISATSAVVATLQQGGRITRATLGQPLINPRNVSTSHEPRACYNCGTVEAVNLIEVRGDGNYLGTIGGGVVGALLGSQIGAGSGRTAAQVAGALGGAYVGNRIEGQQRQSHHFEVLVRMQNGSGQTVSFASDPGYRIGDQVRLSRGVLSHM
jgi:outer membrane lipoprotein SlyB